MDSFESLPTDNSSSPQCQKESPAKRPLGTYFLWALVFASIYLVYRILSTYLNTIIISIALVVLFSPVHSRILRFLGNKRQALASLCSCFLIICLVVIPVFFFISAIIGQGIHSFNGIVEWVQAGGLERILESKLISNVRSYLDIHLSFVDLSTVDVKNDILSLSKNIGQYLLSKGTDFVSNITRLFINFFLMIFILFYLFKEGKPMVSRLTHLIPLSGSQMNKLSGRIQELTRQTFYGTVLTALAQGFVGAIGLAIVGFPALFWGAVMAFASLIPFAGTALIWIPASIYLAFTGEWGLLVFFVLWNTLLVGSIDNFLRPYLIGGESSLSTLVIFLAILGGISVFGIIGLLYGPLIFGLCEVLIYLYELENEEYLNNLDNF